MMLNILLLSIAICVVTGDDNVALFKPSYLSSLYDANSIASHGNDGDRNPVWSGKSCILTKPEVRPWFVIDLLEEYEITQIRISNRQAAPQRLTNGVVAVGNVFDVEKAAIGDFDPTTYTTCADNIESEGAGVLVTKDCTAPVKGRYVVFYLKLQAAGYLQVCEVEVTATGGGLKVVSQGKPAMASSTYGANWEPMHLTDGLSGPTAGRCYCGQAAQDNPWVAVDLLSNYNVRYVTIANRGDSSGNRFKMAHVWIGKKFTFPGAMDMKKAGYCAYLPGPYANGETVLADCQKKIKGRHVLVHQSIRDVINYCEITVYAK